MDISASVLPIGSLTKVKPNMFYVPLIFCFRVSLEQVGGEGPVGSAKQGPILYVKVKVNTRMES